MQTPSTFKRQEQRPEVIERLLNRLVAFYGTKFSDAYTGIDIVDLRRVWAEELSGYSLEEMNRGVNACRSLKWPPTLPEFLTMCRPPITPEAAYYEAVENMALRRQGKNPAYSHPAIYWASATIGWHDMQITPARTMLARWTAVFSKTMQQSNLASVPAPMVELPAPTGHPPTPEMAAKLRGLANLFKAKTVEASQ